MPEGQLGTLLDEVVALEQTVHADLRVYRWRPGKLPELPAIWNWMPDAPAEFKDQSRIRDTVNLSAIVGVRQRDVDEEMDAIETYADAFRAVVDPALNTNQTLNDAAVYAKRRGMRTALERFGEVDVLCVEFFIEARLDRHI